MGTDSGGGVDEPPVPSKSGFDREPSAVKHATEDLCTEWELLATENATEGLLDDGGVVDAIGQERAIGVGGDTGKSSDRAGRTFSFVSYSSPVPKRLGDATDKAPVASAFGVPSCELDAWEDRANPTMLAARDVWYSFPIAIEAALMAVSGVVSFSLVSMSRDAVRDNDSCVEANSVSCISTCEYTASAMPTMMIAIR